MKSVTEWEKEEFTHEKYLKNLRKETANPFFLKKFPYKFLQFLTAARTKLKTNRRRRKNLCE